MNDPVTNAVKDEVTDIAALELAAAAAPIQAALTRIQTGDGSIASVTGEAIALKGELLAALPTLQKIGITNLAGFLNQAITDFIGQQTAAAVSQPSTAAAAGTPSSAA